MIKAVIFDMYETLITHYSSPLYFSAQMCEETGISREAFRKIWTETERKRTLGLMTFEEAIEIILKENGKYSDELFHSVVRHRKEAKRECFHHLHEEIIPLLAELKKLEILIGLISNCYSEEAEVIRNSILFPYFDCACLSCEEGIAKPDPEIFALCVSRLHLKPEECIYIGDGGSHELEAASACGMHAYQAEWYLSAQKYMQGQIIPSFAQLESPLALLDLVTPPSKV